MCNVRNGHVSCLKYTTTLHNFDFISGWECFKLLDTPTATGLDQLPAWFSSSVHQYSMGHSPHSLTFPLRLPLYRISGKLHTSLQCLSYLPSVSFRLSTVSITPVLSRVMENIVVRRFLYPSFVTPPLTLNFKDQYAFRPAGSTTTELTFILHTVTHLLTTNQYVVVIAMDFSRAFDTVRHSILEDGGPRYTRQCYNWLVSYYSGHLHCTRYGGLTLALEPITGLWFRTCQLCRQFE